MKIVRYVIYDLFDRPQSLPISGLYHFRDSNLLPLIQSARLLTCYPENYRCINTTFNNYSDLRSYAFRFKHFSYYNSFILRYGSKSNV